MARIIYPVLQQPPPGALLAIAQFESAWHEPWSEPVRHKIDPRLKVVLGAASGQAPLGPNSDIIVKLAWYAPLSEPKRFKPATPAPDQPFFYYEPEPPEFEEIPWFGWLSEPVRLPVGLKAQYQHYWEGPNRLLPPVNVTATMAATETNDDIALIGIQVYSGVAPSGGVSGANVSISEVPAQGDGFVAVEET